MRCAEFCKSMSLRRPWRIFRSESDVLASATLRRKCGWLDCSDHILKEVTGLIASNKVPASKYLPHKVSEAFH